MNDPKLEELLEALIEDVKDYQFERDESGLYADYRWVIESKQAILDYFEQKRREWMEEE